MVSITTRAKERLRDIRGAAALEHPDLTLRMIPSGPGVMGLLPDVRRAGDVKHEGTPVLLVDRDVATTISGATIGCRATRKGAKLVLRRPRGPRAASPPDNATRGGESS